MSEPQAVDGWRQCPRCGKWYRWPGEYADHAWKEKP